MTKQLFSPLKKMPEIAIRKQEKLGSSHTQKMNLTTNGNLILEFNLWIKFSTIKPITV